VFFWVASADSRAGRPVCRVLVLCSPRLSGGRVWALRLS